MTALTWKRLPNGDRQAAEHPIRLIKPYSRRHDAAGWLVKVPLDRDSTFDDGWHWTTVVNPTYLKNRGGMHLEGGDYNEARALVAEHLPYILEQIPADYGQPEPAPEPAPSAADPGPAFAYRRVTDDIARQIKEHGGFASGAKLPSEPELETQYGVSRIVIRRALDELRSMGLIVTEQGRGSFVAETPTIEETRGWRCGCGCGTPVRETSVYAPGHDARHRDQLVDLLVGNGTVRDRATRISHLITGLRGQR